MSETHRARHFRKPWPWREIIGLVSALIFVTVLIAISIEGGALAGMLRLH